MQHMGTGVPKYWSFSSSCPEGWPQISSCWWRGMLNSFGRAPTPSFLAPRPTLVLLLPSQWLPLGRLSCVSIPGWEMPHTPSCGRAPLPVLACRFRGFLGRQCHRTRRLCLFLVTVQLWDGHTPVREPETCPGKRRPPPILTPWTRLRGALLQAILSLPGPDPPSPPFSGPWFGTKWGRVGAARPSVPLLPRSLPPAYPRSSPSPSVFLQINSPKLEFINLNIISGPGSQPYSP